MNWQFQVNSKCKEATSSENLITKTIDHTRSLHTDLSSHSLSFRAVLLSSLLPRYLDSEGGNELLVPAHLGLHIWSQAALSVFQQAMEAQLIRLNEARFIDFRI